MELFKTLIKYLDPAYNLYISIPPEIVRFKDKFARESNLKINTWYCPSLFASAIALASLKLLGIDLDSKEHSNETKNIKNAVKELYDARTGGFRDRFSEEECSIQGTRSAIRIIKLLNINEERKWQRSDTNALILDFLKDKQAMHKIIDFVNSTYNEFDGGYTNTINEKYSDIFSTSSASWIIYQLGHKAENVNINKTKEYAKKICSVLDKEGHIKCRPIISSESSPTVRATAQYIDMHNNHIENYRIYNNNLSVPNTWRYDKPRIRESIIDLYNSLRNESYELMTADCNSDRLQMIVSDIRKFEYKGGYCFFAGQFFVPNLLATYYAVVLLSEIKKSMLCDVSDLLNVTKIVDFIKSCFSVDGIYRFFPYNRKYYRLHGYAQPIDGDADGTSY